MLCCALSLTLPLALLPQQAPPASSARILLLPKRIVSGEPATLAVLDANGRLTPGVTVNFSNGDHLVTNATGRALFVAPLNPGVIYATIASRPTRVYTTILAPAEVSSASLHISSAPRFASLADRFDLSGSGFCGEADANIVRVAGKPALVLASSPAVLVALPPADLEPGRSAVEASCAGRPASPFSITFLALTLDADSSPLAPGEHRTLTVRVRGTVAKVTLEARNLSPEVAELAGGNPARVSSNGGAENAAQFELTGRQRGNFLISVRLPPTPTPLRP
ncbi:MAG TPA: hypothetical protein VN943_04695 [Candidatus Acidoferrum sp.]|nr:hypothetical protein [Candidatus Acidoferrum sp.]